MDEISCKIVDSKIPGFKWRIFDDGSGGLESETGEKYCSYDLQSNEFEFVKKGWSYYPELAANFKEFQYYIERRVLKYLERKEKKL